MRFHLLIKNDNVEDFARLFAWLAENVCHAQFMQFIKND